MQQIPAVTVSPPEYRYKYLPTLFPQCILSPKEALIVAEGPWGLSAEHGFLSVPAGQGGQCK